MSKIYTVLLKRCKVSMCIVLVISEASARNFKTYRKSKGPGESAHVQTHLCLRFCHTQSTNSEVEKGSDGNLDL